MPVQRRWPSRLAALISLTLVGCAQGDATTTPAATQEVLPTPIVVIVTATPTPTLPPDQPPDTPTPIIIVVTATPSPTAAPPPTATGVPSPTPSSTALPLPIQTTPTPEATATVTPNGGDNFHPDADSHSHTGGHGCRAPDPHINGSFGPHADTNSSCAAVSGSTSDRKPGNRGRYHHQFGQRTTEHDRLDARQRSGRPGVSFPKRLHPGSGGHGTRHQWAQRPPGPACGPSVAEIGRHAFQGVRLEQRRGYGPPPGC